MAGRRKRRSIKTVQEKINSLFGRSGTDKPPPDTNADISNFTSGMSTNKGEWIVARATHNSQTPIQQWGNRWGTSPADMYFRDGGTSIHKDGQFMGFLGDVADEERSKHVSRLPIYPQKRLFGVLRIDDGDGPIITPQYVLERLDLITEVPSKHAKRLRMSKLFFVTDGIDTVQVAAEGEKEGVYTLYSNAWTQVRPSPRDNFGERLQTNYMLQISASMTLMLATRDVLKNKSIYVYLSDFVKGTHVHITGIVVY